MIVHTLKIYNIQLMFEICLTFKTSCLSHSKSWGLTDLVKDA